MASTSPPPDGTDLEELAGYVEHAKVQWPMTAALTVEFDGEDALLTATDRHQPFERLRRITGYLVGSVDRWNNAKRAELGDRVKHSV